MACDKISCCSLFAVSGHNRFHMSVVVIIVSKKQNLLLSVEMHRMKLLFCPCRDAQTVTEMLLIILFFLHFLQQCYYN